MGAEPTFFDPEQDAIVFTDAAARKVGELIEEEENPNLKLWIYL
jgi:Fe-S cluster assembly iron-binding protein IscA